MLPCLRRLQHGCSLLDVGSPSRSYVPACWEGGRGARGDGGFLDASRAMPAGAVLGTVLFLVMTGVFVGQGMLVVAHHDTPAWMVRPQHGAPASWWGTRRVGGVGMRASVASAGSAPPGRKICTLASHIRDALSPYFSLDDVLTENVSFSVKMAPFGADTATLPGCQRTDKKSSRGRTTAGESACLEPSPRFAYSLSRAYFLLDFFPPFYRIYRCFL